MKTAFLAALALACVVTPSFADNNPFSGATSISVSMEKLEAGKASYYGGYHHGRKMANGQRFNQRSDSCAHKKLPFGTRLKVTTKAGRSVLCVVRDRGPYIRGRIIDMSVAGAESLGMIGPGVLMVTVERVR